MIGQKIFVDKKMQPLKIANWERVATVHVLRKDCKVSVHMNLEDNDLEFDIAPISLNTNI